MKKYGILLSIIIFPIISALILTGCGGGSRGNGGGGGNGISTVSGTLSSVDRVTITAGTVWSDSDPAHTTTSLASGAYRLQSVRSGWSNMRARVTINGTQWVGSTAAEVLSNQPTVNINITLSPATQTTSIGGVVRDDSGNRVRNARVLFTTRIIFPADQTSANDGSYGSIVAVTDNSGQYLLVDVPVGVTGVISASKVGFGNRELAIDTVHAGDVVDFSLIPAGGAVKPFTPTLAAIESYTMPDTLSVLSSGNSTPSAYKAIKSYVSPRFKDAVAGKSNMIRTQATPAGSLMEVDLYWNAFTNNDSRNIAGYGIYRTTSPSIEFAAIDFIRDPYANFYGDMGAELTPYQIYYYAVTAVDVAFLDSNNNPVVGAESDRSNTLSIRPIGQLALTDPSEGKAVSANPTFRWQSLSGASTYRILVFSGFPKMPATPVIDQTVNGGTSFTYNGAALVPGNTYFWVILAGDTSGKAFSYSQIRSFNVQ